MFLLKEKVGQTGSARKESMLTRRKGRTRLTEVTHFRPTGSLRLHSQLTETLGDVDVFFTVSFHKFCSEYPNPLEMPCVQEIAKAHGKTPGQILVRHELQRGLVVIPKSTHPTRIQDNINVRTAC